MTKQFANDERLATISCLQGEIVTTLLARSLTRSPKISVRLETIQSALDAHEDDSAEDDWWKG